MRRLLLIAAALLWAASANAQSFFPTPGGQAVQGTMNLCPSANGQAVPCGGGLSLPIPVIELNNVPVVQVQPATVTTAVNTGTTSGTTATLTNIPGKTMYICGFAASAGSAATAITISVTVTGLRGGTMTWTVGAPVTAVGVTGNTVSQTFSPCLPAVNQSTSIAVAAGALSTSGVGQTVNVWGMAQ